jgi:hypothetical protein
MQILIRATQCLGVLVLLAVFCLARPIVASHQGASISGAVSVDGKPVGGILVLLYDMGSTPEMPVGFLVRERGGASQRTTTDELGRYVFNSLAAGSYSIVPFVPGSEFPALHPSQVKLVSLKSDEGIDGIDFSLPLGAIVTGKVTRPDGQPAVEVLMSISRAGEQPMNNVFTETDDRGTYRAYGLAPGKYKVCAEPYRPISYGLEATFCYSSGNDTEATIDVAAGQELSNIDIVLGAASATYEANGRVIDDNGQPVAGANYSYNLIRDNIALGTLRFENSSTDQNGRFRIAGLVSGKYAINLQFDPDSAYYGSGTTFQISNGNVSGIEIKVHTGSTVSGIVVMEGTQEPQVLSQIPSVQLDLMSIGAAEDGPMSQQMVNPNPDGSFQATGTAPGVLSIATFGGPPGFSILRIEKDGVVQSNGIEISAGQKVTGLRVVLGYGTARLHGQVVVQGGVLPDGARLLVRMQSTSDGEGGTRRAAFTDTRGLFEIDNLPDGQYQVLAGLLVGDKVRTAKPQVVSVSTRQPQEINLVLNLAELTQ